MEHIFKFVCICLKVRVRLTTVHPDRMGKISQFHGCCIFRTQKHLGMAERLLLTRPFTVNHEDFTHFWNHANRAKLINSIGLKKIK
jgi:hypothetical protein